MDSVLPGISSVCESIGSDLAQFRRAVILGEAYRPLFVKIKLSFDCNLRCAICNHWRERREAPLPMERFRDVIVELAELGCRKVHLTGGEPLLRDQVPELVALAAGLGMRVTMTTNGTLVDKDLARRLVRAGLKGVNISIDSPDRKTHDRIRGVDGAWKKAGRAVEYFNKYRKKQKPVIRINTVVSSQNYRTLAPLPEFAAQHGADRIHLIAVDGFANPGLIPSSKHIQAFNEKIAPQIAAQALALNLVEDEADAYPFGRSPIEIKFSKKGLYAFGFYEKNPCFVPWFHSLVDYNGLVYLCCMTREQTLPLGDLKEAAFAEIWAGAAYRSVRRGAQPPMRSHCLRCDNFLAENGALAARMRELDHGPSS